RPPPPAPQARRSPPRPPAPLGRVPRRVGGDAILEPPAATFPTAGVPPTVPRAAPTAPPEEGPQQEEHPEEEQREEDESEREEASRLLHPHHLGSVSGLGQAVGDARVIGRHSDGDPCQDHQND